MPTSQELMPRDQKQQSVLRPVMPELDSIRGLAILMVIFYHGLYWQIDVAQYHGILRLFLTSMWLGRSGVNLFFVLSGFLITGILVDSRSRPNYYRHFYVRRALRIFPVYLLIIAILAATRYAPISFILLSLLYLSNLTPLFGVAIAYPVLWSLAVEEHFYLFWPALVRNTRNLGLLISCVGVIILTPILRLMSYYIAARNGPVSFVVNDYTWNSLDGLACGALLAVSLRQFQPPRKTLWIVAASLLGIAILLIGVGIPLGIMSRQGPFGMALQIVPFNFAFTALLCCFLLLGTSARKPIVLSKPLQELGRISYGLYLVHILIFDLYMHVIVFLWKGGADLSHLFRLIVRFGVCAGVSIGIAILSRDYFEERFLRLKDRLS